MLLHDPVSAETDPKTVLEWFHMDVACSLFDCFIEEGINHADNSIFIRYQSLV